MVVLVARSLPRRQRNVGECLGKPHRRGHCRAQRRSIPVPHLHPLRIPDDAGVAGYLLPVYVVALFLIEPKHQMAGRAKAPDL